jgi:hypothetical protein
MTTSQWAKIVAVIAAIAGATGSVLTPLLGQSIASGVQTVLEAVSGLLLLIPIGGATVAITTSAKAKVLAEVGALPQAPKAPQVVA